MIGSIVALGVFQQGWTPSQALTKFQSLASRAFSPRNRLTLPVIKHVVQPFCNFRYTSDGIMEALGTAFSKQEYLFGTPPALKESSSRSAQNRRPCVKVGVVTCLEGRNQPCLLANYSRNRNERGGQGKSKAELSHVCSGF